MNIALIGYGKMGHMIEQIALQRGHKIVSIIDINNQEDFDSEAFASADVAIEFTNPTAAYGNYLKAFKHHVKVVSGSTGWQKDHQADVEKLCTEGGNTLHFLVVFMFFCYSHRLKRALVEHGFKVYYIGYNYNTQSFSYAFLTTDKLQNFKQNIYPILRDRY